TGESALQALLEPAEDEESKAIHDGSPAELVTSLVEVEGAPELAGHLYPRLKAVAKEGVARLEAYQLHHLADDVQKVAGPSGPSLLLEHQPVAAVRGSLAEVALQPHLSPDLTAKISLQAVGAWLRGQARYREFTDALAVLRDTTLEERRILVAETLDLASHRLD